jgi:hypothetical protein
MDADMLRKNASEDDTRTLYSVIKNDSYERNKEVALVLLGKIWPGLSSIQVVGDADLLAEILSKCDDPNPLRSMTAAYQLRQGTHQVSALTLICVHQLLDST